LPNPWINLSVSVRLRLSRKGLSFDCASFNVGQIRKARKARK
jgi:hypothetical protein